MSDQLVNHMCALLQGLLQSDQRKAEDYFRLAKSVFAKALELVCKYT